ncbi:MAG TPA: selenium-binding protein SBP56-related protein, partial [Gemmatimonadales bacterium]
MNRRMLLLLGALAVTIAAVPTSVLDESVFVKGLRAGEREKLLYVWTRDGDGKESDFLSVVDVDPRSGSYGTILATVPTHSSANEAHHFGYTANADRIMAAGMFTNTLFIYDVKSDPRKPRLLRTVALDPTG